MSTQDPFDRVRKANPVDARTLPGAPLGMAGRITAAPPRRFRIKGPTLGLASMAFVLVIGGLTTTLMMGGTDETPVTQAPSTTTVDSTTPTSIDPVTATTTTDQEGTHIIELGAAPWSAAPLPRSEVPRHLIDDWAGAGNQTWCSALYPTDPASLSADGVTRSADFGGGWAVAWDLPDGPGRDAADGYCADCGRSAFGIAGVDQTGTSTDLSIWPDQLAWDDGSRAGYGLEGLAAPDSGAPVLSYLLVEGQGCLYNVWSFLGEDHLLALIDSLRPVEGMQADPVELVDRADLETAGAGRGSMAEIGAAKFGGACRLFRGVD